MRVLFDAWTLNDSQAGMAKSLLFLYEWCHRLDPSFMALGFGYCGDDYLRYADQGIVMMGDCLSRDLDAIVATGGFDVLHFPACYTRFRKIKGIPHVLTLHDVMTQEPGFYSWKQLVKGAWWPKLKIWLKLRASLSFADVIVTPSEYARRTIEEFGGTRAPIEVVPWGVTLPDAAPCEAPMDVPYFLYAGGYHERKGIDILVRAFYRLVEDGRTRARLVLAGWPSPLGPETDRMIRAGVERGSIVQAGHVSDEELCALYAHATCSVYLSRAEGFGLPLIEAMRYGCPVIASNASCLPEVGGEAACYVDRGDTGEVAAMMLRLQDDAAFRSARVQAGYENLRRFSWERSARAFLDLLERVAK